ncbi:MAG: Maf family protein [Oscillospiraceae bacterium]|nr:Maf family protein [Oscillospiraceae bacterium]
MKIILASASPRRRELLDVTHLKYEVIPAVGEEKPYPELLPTQLAARRSRDKAAEVAAGREGDIVIAADTLVALDSVMYGKPKDADDARRILLELAGRTHRVYTGITVAHGGDFDTQVEQTNVWMRELTERELDEYIASGEPMDKAGAYAIQGLASVFITRVDGDYCNVVGLPVSRLSIMLKKLGVELI